MEYGCVGFPLTTETAFGLKIIGRNGSLVPSTITGTPAYTFYAPDGTSVKTGNMSASDLDSKTGLRYASVDISSFTGIAANTVYDFLVSYVVSGTTYYAHGTIQTR
jgi:hypothetical protein